MIKRDMPGFAIGGLSGGEEKSVFWRMVTLSTDILPKDKPRYLMGVGYVVRLFIYLGFYVSFNTVQVISRRVVGKAEETSIYSLSGLCTVNCRPTASNYQLSHLRPCQEPNPGLRGGRRECYHSATVAPSDCL